MDFKQLQYFLAVAEHLNFSRAAEALYISQPTLSYRIAELEKELGTTLFLRNRRNVYLTPAGGALLPLANKALDCAQEIRNLAQRGFPADEQLKSLSVAFDSTEDHFETIGVTDLIARFATGHPEVDLEMHQADGESCVAQLMNETLDVAFLILRHNETLPSILNQKAIHRDRLMIVTRQDPEVTNSVEALRKYPLVMAQSHPRGLTRIARCFEGMGVEVRPILVDSIPVSFTYVRAGWGAIILPENYFRLHNYQGLSAFEIPSPAASLTHTLVWNKAHQNPCIQILVNSFEQVPSIEEG